VTNRLDGERAWLLLSVIVAVLALVATIIIPAACGASNAAMVAPIYDATRVVCREKQEAAVEGATTREEATTRVAEVRQRCDVAYRGLEAAGLLLEQVHEQK